MKICLVSHEYPRAGGGPWGGVGAYTSNIARALASFGHEVYVIGSGETESREEDDAVTVIRLPLNAPKIITQRAAGQVLDYSSRVRECVENLHGEVGLDLVEFADFAAEGYSFITSGTPRPPHVLRLHTCLEIVFKNDGREWTEETRNIADMELETIRAARHVTSPSVFLAELTAGAARISASNVRIVPNPVDTNFFTPSKGHDEALVLNPGRLQMLKGTHVLGRAIPQVLAARPAARFIFAGRDTLSGPGGASYRQHLEATLDRRALGSIQFTGEVSRTRMLELYRRAAVVVVPSIYDNFPNTVLEAMACGKAVAASRVGGIPEIIKNDEGILVTPDRPEELARAVLRYLGDRDLRENAGMNARRAAVERFSPGVIAAGMTHTYEEIVDKSREPCASA
ncbi:MAG: hypothetical protein DRP79_03520 [Planctomycetota bacterium]|nr:MAG: hypothetical protein DRP79_03520 [Planctomycetota bacterium]